MSGWIVRARYTCAISPGPTVGGGNRRITDASLVNLLQKGRSNLNKRSLMGVESALRKIEPGPSGQGGKMNYRNTAFVACLTVVLCGLSQFAAGATLCVAKNPSPGCPYSTISAAV